VVGVRRLFIEPGSPWEIGYVESFNGKLRNELLNRKIVYSLWESEVLIRQWRHHHTTPNRLRSTDFSPSVLWTSMFVSEAAARQRALHRHRRVAGGGEVQAFLSRRRGGPAASS
jgi:hypothetical protein